MLPDHFFDNRTNIMKRFIGIVFLALCGCAAVPRDVSRESPCEVSEASYECQIYRYLHVNQ